MSDEKRGSTPVERWFDHGIKALTVAAIIYGSSMLLNLKTSMEIMTVRFDALSAQLQEVKSSTGRRYTADDAARDLSIVNGRLSDHEMRLRHIESSNNNPEHR